MGKAAARSDDDDRISSLPNDIITEHILSSLPVRDAARMSFLSTKWRNLWTGRPALVLDETFWPANGHHGQVSKLMFNLYTALLLHRGPTHEFSISIPEALRRFPDHIDQILMFLEEVCSGSSSSIDSLTITAPAEADFDKQSTYDLPTARLLSSSFWTSRLKTLRLFACNFRGFSQQRGVSFQGFAVLTVLEIRRAIMDMDADEMHSAPWIFKCAVLSDLTLHDLGPNYPDIVIEAPELSRFHLVGRFNSLHFKDTPVLKTAIFHSRSHNNYLLKAEAHRDEMLWGGLAAVDSLSVSSDLYKFLTSGRGAIRLSPLEMLTHLTLDQVLLTRRSYARFVLHMMTTLAPNLSRLTISMKQETAYDDISSHYMVTTYGNSIDARQLQAMMDCASAKYQPGRRLERVEAKNLEGTQHEMAFIEWLSITSPMLGEVVAEMSARVSATQERLIRETINKLGY